MLLLIVTAACQQQDKHGAQHIRKKLQLGSTLAMTLLTINIISNLISAMCTIANSVLWFTFCAFIVVLIMEK